ncbi:HET domain-containing protein [Fusarium sp. Ph1]|nr:HET domain-containing protein [Fusarium sp. Ph1]
MRLLEVNLRTLQDFTDETRVSYAILSHRWEDDEVSFQDLTQGTASQRKGYQKVDNFCLLAKREGFRYVWIDTCCIDKSSSAELSEAINSMYRWYQQADTCYAYLSDCSYEGVSRPGSTQFQESQWFTRGWTLQELIAPAEVVFLSAEWREFGTRRRLCVQVSNITKIDEGVLRNPEFLDSFCAAKKLSWAATRKTTKLEDQAYSLMGLFDVNMPLLYGEGNKAFLRLQTEILRTSNDQSLFAWIENPGNAPDNPSSLSSLLTTSLLDFEGCHTIQYRSRDIDPSVAEFPQEVVGGYIKLKALSVPFDHSFTSMGTTTTSESHQQYPSWLASAYQKLEGSYPGRDRWVVFLDDCSEQDKTIGIFLKRDEGGTSRIHGPSRILLPKGLGPGDHAELKERIFYVRSVIKDELPLDEILVHLRHVPAEYRLCQISHPTQGLWEPHWCNNEASQESFRRNPHPWLILEGWMIIAPQYFSLGFRNKCPEDLLPPFTLAFCYLNDKVTVVRFEKGSEALNQDPETSRKPESPDLRLGPQQFGLTRDYSVIVNAREGACGKILLYIFVKNKWTGEMLGEYDLSG